MSLSLVSQLCRQGAVTVARQSGNCVTTTSIRSLSCSVRLNNTDLTVIGSGQMGAGIAQVSARAGHNVTLVDVSDEALSAAFSGLEKNVARVAGKAHKDDTDAAMKEIEDTMSRISTTTDLEAAAASSELVIEAVPEIMSLKHDIFARADAVAPPETLFASNTSSLRIGDIAACCTQERRERFGGLHFFNPVPVMRLLEVVRTPETSDATHAALRTFGESIGKTVVDCKDTPGFIVNRLLVPYLLEAARMVERGDATKEDVDVAMRLGCGHPMGPLALIDYVGTDTCSFIAAGWDDGSELFRPVNSIDKLAEEGKLGVKSGEGFYKYGK
eukprot:UC1_evm1s357